MRLGSKLRNFLFQPSGLIEPHKPVTPQTEISNERNTFCSFFKSTFSGSPNISTPSYPCLVSLSKVCSIGSIFLKEESVMEYLNPISYHMISYFCRGRIM